MARIKDRQGNCELHQVTRSDNEEVDHLAKMAVVGEQHLTRPFQFEELHTPTIDEEESFPIKEGETWMTPV